MTRQIMRVCTVLIASVVFFVFMASKDAIETLLYDVSAQSPQESLKVMMTSDSNCLLDLCVQFGSARDQRHSRRNAAPGHIIVVNSQTCSGSSAFSTTLQRLLEFNGIRPCTVQTEALTAKKYHHIFGRRVDSLEERMEAVYFECLKKNAPGIVLKIFPDKEPDWKQAIDSFSRRTLAVVHTISIRRSNLLYYLVCQVMDFSKHHPASYVHLPNGTVLQHGPALPWGWFRHHHDVLRVHLGISDLETQIQQNQGTLDDCKPENNCFFMEDAFAWEYSGQFCINSAALWQRIATLVELSRDGFFSQRLMPQANSRKFRSTHDIVSNHDEVALFLKEQRMDYFLVP